MQLPFPFLYILPKKGSSPASSFHIQKLHLLLRIPTISLFHSTTFVFYWEGPLKFSMFVDAFSFFSKKLLRRFLPLCLDPLFFNPERHNSFLGQLTMSGQWLPLYLRPSINVRLLSRFISTTFLPFHFSILPLPPHPKKREPTPILLHYVKDT